MELPRTIADFEARAAEVLADGPHGYYAGGAGDELTLRANVEAWRRIGIRPRVLVDVSERSSETTVLGRSRPHPVFVAPTAFHGLADPEGERATARAAAGAGAVFCLSSLAGAGPAEIAAAAPSGERWLQLYVFRDRGVSNQLVREAAENGFEAIVVTVDLPVLGIRDRDLRTEYTLPDGVVGPGAAGGRTFSVLEIGELIDPSLTWVDIERLVESSELPVIVKGVLTPEDALLAADHGVAGVVVSNHGGRQLDTVPAGAEALPAIADAIGDRVDVLVDGGVRRGTDVLKALALGARAVMVGRPVIWGLVVGGEPGARAVIDLLVGELDVALALAGVSDASGLGPDCVQVRG